MQECAAEALRNLATITENAATIAAAGAITLLAQLLGPGSTAEVLLYASGAMMKLALYAGNQVSLVIPSMVRLLRAGSASDVQYNAARTLPLLADIAANAAAIAAAGAVPPLVQLLRPSYSSLVQQLAAGVLAKLALIPEIAATIAAAGSIPPLVVLLAPGSPSDLHYNTAGALMYLALNADKAADIAAAGAIPRLEGLLLAPRSRADVKQMASRALLALGFNNADNRAAMTATTAELLQQMQELGTG
ncbi:hypothetical protein FOA52_005040 [Chlamydomonas sp. UWO 241]|nr:hypothetical protein FOA52_005040 [Chlamydomonas sp. UWO 241]